MNNNKIYGRSQHHVFCKFKESVVLSKEKYNKLQSVEPSLNVLCLRKVIIEVEMDGLQVLIIIHAQVVEFFIFIWDLVLFKGFLHIQIDAIIFPCVAGSMAIVHCVTS